MTNAFPPSKVQTYDFGFRKMEPKKQTNSNNSSSPSSSSPSTPTSNWEWDQPFTEEELEAIDAIFHSATTPQQQHSRNVRRRLPNSLLKSTIERNPFPLTPHRPPENMRLPVMNFGGNVKYSRTVSEVENAAVELIKFVEVKKRETGHAVLGFDIEWRPTFKKGVSPGKAAVMQICGDSNHCYVMHLIHSGIPENLRSLLEDPTSVKVGVGIGTDSVKVLKDHNVLMKDLLDLSRLANQKLGGHTESWSLGSLTEKLIGKQLEKPNRIRLGNWEVESLSKAQLHYAATDAYASWYLYQVLSSFPDAAISKSEEGQGMPPQ